ncbi:uncharacterized protein AAG666_014326 isoform 2-T2 [Megaptera novaeangliae]
MNFRHIILSDFQQYIIHLHKMGKHFSTAFPAFPQKPKPPHKQKSTLCFIKKITQLQIPMLPGSPLKNGSEKSPVLRASIIKLCYDMKGLGSSTLDENYFVQSLVPSAGSSFTGDIETAAAL